MRFENILFLGFWFQYVQVEATRPARNAESDATQPGLSQHIAKACSDAGKFNEIQQPYAFVTMGYDPDGTGSPHSLWGAFALAQSVHELSAFPLIVLSNTTRFPDGTCVPEAFSQLNAHVRPIRSETIPDHFAESADMPCVYTHSCRSHFYKLQAWTLKQFKKVIWLDSDAILTRSIDWLFQQQGMWVAQDNWNCSLVVEKEPAYTPQGLWTRAKGRMNGFLGLDDYYKQSDRMNSGLMLIEPSEATYLSLVEHGHQMNPAPPGDQVLINSYYEKIGKPPKLVTTLTASFGQCFNLGVMPGGKPGQPPAFMHKSDQGNTCFRIDAPRDICESRPGGTYWREQFCKAASKVGLSASNFGNASSSAARICVM